VSDSIPPEVRVIVLDRAKRACERCLQRKPVLHLHHRIQRSCGGRDTVANLVAVCPRCHDRIHQQIPFDDVYFAGWLLRSWQDPQRTAIRMPRGWMVLFDSGDCRRLASQNPRVARPVGRT
jgi:hypothetical protein